MNREQRLEELLRRVQAECRHDIEQDTWDDIEAALAEQEQNSAPQVRFEQAMGGK